MKNFTTTMLITLALGAVVSGLTSVLPFDEAGRSAWWLGALIASVLGLLTLVIKTQLSGGGLKGTAAMKALVTAQVLSFMLRLIAVGVGALALKLNDGSPMTFVIAFFIVSLAHQALETRTLLVKTSEVIS
jgi:hypothetical protein